MSEQRDLWLAARHRARTSRPAPQIVSCTAVRQPDDGVEIVIRGHHLTPRVSPPAIHVGGQPARAIRVDADGLRATVSDARPGDEVRIDLGANGQVAASLEGLE